MTPSPNPTVLRPDPKRWAQRYDAAQREAHKAQVRAHALAAGHPSCAPYDHERESCLPTVALSGSTLEASLIVRALVQSSSAASRELGERIDADVRARYTVSVDDCPPLGTKRPGGVA